MQTISEKNIARPTIAILIPCHNEEKMIAKCVASCLSQTRPADMVLVIDDGSGDNSVKILEGFGNRIKVIKLPKNTGNKSYVQQIGLSQINTDIFISTDADSILDKHFVEYIENSFTDPAVGAVAGYVMSTKHNWLTALREIEYFVGQEVHKTAQSHINYLYVIPGCASAFRTENFKKNIAFDHDTITEDLDFTYKLHLLKCRIAYQKKAVVWTQDPADIKSYTNQLRRWYGGGWQNLLKHRQTAVAIPACAFELALIHCEGMLFAMSMLILPLISIKTFGAIVAAYTLTMIIIGAITSISRKRLDVFLYSPLYLAISAINSYIFCEQFFVEVLRHEKNLEWFTPKRR